MNILTSKKSFLLAPVIALLCFATLVVIWANLAPDRVVPLFDNDGASPVELMTLPLFALIIPLVWLCPPAAGNTRRQCLWAALWSLLAVMAIVRQTDLHKLLFANIWPDIASTFRGTVYKMRFLKAAHIPFAPKLFVLGFFAAFFVSVIVPLVKYIVPLIKGFFRREPVAWTMATFGTVSTMVILIDRLPANLRKSGVAVSDGALALMKAFEEGGEMVMALLALLAILQSHLIFARRAS
jgi:hypothetical protein